MIKATTDPVTKSGLLAREQRISRGERAAALVSEPTTERIPIRMLRLSQVVEKTGLHKWSKRRAWAKRVSMSYKSNAVFREV